MLKLQRSLHVASCRAPMSKFGVESRKWLLINIPGPPCVDVQLVPDTTQPHCPATIHRWFWHGWSTDQNLKSLRLLTHQIQLKGLSAHYLLNQPPFEVLPHIGSKKDFLKFLTFGISSPLCSSQYFKVTDDQQGSLDSGDGSEDLVTLTALAHLWEDLM